MPGYKAAELIKSVTEPLTLTDNGWDLEPKKLVLGWTRERIELPLHGRVAARVEGKSGLARIGLSIHCTAPTIHAGFVGTIQLEIVNHGPIPIKLRPSVSICQLVFEQTLGMSSKAYAGQFSGQEATYMAPRLISPHVAPVASDVLTPQRMTKRRHRETAPVSMANSRMNAGTSDAGMAG